MAAVAAHVEDAVRRYFEADDLENAGGLVLDMDSAGRAAGIDAKIETTVQSVTVTSVSENEAHVELEAVQSYVSHVRRGQEQRTLVNISGPLRCRHEHGRWKVVDHHLDGQPISERYSILDGEAIQAKGLSLRLASVYVGPKDVVAFVEIENHGGEQAKLVSVSLAPNRCYCAGVHTHSEFAPGSSSTVGLGWQKSVPISTRILRLAAVVRTPDGKLVSFDWAIDLHNGRADGLVQNGRPFRDWSQDPRLFIGVVGVSLVAIVAMTGVPPQSFFVGLVLAAGLGIAYPFLHGLLHRR